MLTCIGAGLYATVRVVMLVSYSWERIQAYKENVEVCARLSLVKAFGHKVLLKQHADYVQDPTPRLFRVITSSYYTFLIISIHS